MNKSTMRGFVVVWIMALFTYAFMSDHEDEQYRATLIGLVSLAAGYYIGKNERQNNDDGS